MKLDWQHVVLMAIGAGCVTAVILLGHGNTLLSVCAALGGTTGIVGMLKYSPLYGPPSKGDSSAPAPKG